MDSYIDNLFVAFAVMRNSHEALRAAITEMDNWLADVATLNDFRAAFSEYSRVIDVHSKIEELSLYPMLAKVNGGPIGLEDIHVEDHKLHAELASALSSCDDATTSERFNVLKVAYTSWKTYHLDHLSEEEKIVMPLTQKTAPTPEGRSVFIHEHVVNPAMVHNFK